MVECRYYGACRYASGNCSNGGDNAPDCEDFVQMPDVGALLALADELEKDACWEVQSPGVDNFAWRLKDTCDRIREALGVAR